MTVLKHSIKVNRYIGASTDTKPSTDFTAGGLMPIGSTFYEYDTGVMYITYDGTNWAVKDTGDIEGAFSQGVFGEATLQCYGNGSANWCRGEGQAALEEKSSTGWYACLYGGLMSGTWYDYARVIIPVNEMELPNFKSALWSYYQMAAQTMGVNIVFGIHDPTDFDKRAEITQQANIATLEKGAGWNAHELDLTVTQFFFYGENTTGTGLTEGTNYTMAQFQADTIFKNWTIYRITLEYGWEASGTFQDVFVADVKLNGVMIPMKPDSGGSGRIARRTNEVTAGAVALTIAPKTPYRLLSMDVHCDGVLATGELFTITKDAYAGDHFDTVIFSQDLFIGSITSLHVVFGEGYEFPGDDELDIANANTGNDDIGVTVLYQTVFP